MKFKLEEKNIVLGCKAESKEEAIRMAGEELLKHGYVEKEYIDAMFDREKVMSTYLGLGIAIPHGTNEAKEKIKKSGVVFLQFPDGVLYGKEKAYLVIGIAGLGNDHLEILSNISIKVSDELVEKLKNTDRKADFIEEFGSEEV